MPTIQDVMQTIADYLDEHDKEDPAGREPRRSQLHPDVRSYAMMARTCYLEFDPISVSPMCIHKLWVEQNYLRVLPELSVDISEVMVRQITGNEVEYPEQSPPQRMLLPEPFGEGPSNAPVRFYTIPNMFTHKLEKTLTTTDIQSGALTLFWSGFCEHSLPSNDSQLTLIDWLGNHWECSLQLGSKPYVTCQIVGQWKDICKARRLTAGVVVKFGATLPSNNRVIYFKISPFIGVRTTLVGPTRDAKRKQFYQTEEYYML
ncbi:hypothetical protein TSUD_373860 [Trifolium subterraneum]|uniref:TF-B3 domain-containing protein n=1 Tax=Trifolium subterraneum TaxID=3900 RepID=A0A2Z6MWA8_TRISU|nr:hypothetical protein TSUD_373860 [Trifolium subterraneum]